MISETYEKCRETVKRINSVLDNEDTAPDSKLLKKALGRKLGELRTIIINFELGYSMDGVAQDILRETERLLQVGK